MNRRLGKILIAVCAFLTGAISPCTVSAVDIQWSGQCGSAIAAPETTIGKEQYKNTPVITTTAVADGDYQGVGGTFAQPVNLSDYSGVKFFIRNNFCERAGCVIRFVCKSADGARYGTFAVFTVTNEWTEVIVPFNPATWEWQEEHKNFGFGESFAIYPFEAMNKKGHELEIADFQFLRPSDTSMPLTVHSYSYVNAPDSGDDFRLALTDGDLATQAYWQQYSDDGDVIFDLGSVFAVTDIKIEADSIPAHNFSQMLVTASIDGKNYYPATVLRNTDTNTEKVVHGVDFNGKVIGRFFRFRAVKPRPDFKVYLGEISFAGYIPAAEEEIADAAKRYTVGPEMAPRDSGEYAKAMLGDFTMYINRNNGVINGVQYKDKLWIERMAGHYLRQSREEDIAISGYDDKVIDLQADKNSVELKVINPALPGVEITKRYTVDAAGALLEYVRVTGKKELPREFLRVSTEVILNRDFRQTGVYETSGAGHTMAREFASDVHMEIEVDNVPFLSFENKTHDVTMLHTRISANGEFIYFDPCVDDARALTLLANGWRMPMMCVVPADSCGQELSATLRLSITAGGLLNAYDNYLSNPDVAAYRSRIHRPEWLRDQLIHGAPGWDGLCKGVSERWYENQARLFDRGYFVSGMREDLDFFWGDFPTDGVVQDWFGGQKDAAELAALLLDIRKIYPGVKLGLYTWLWSCFYNQDIVKNHPDWFVKESRSGAVANFFPGVNTNFLRLWNDESIDEAVDSLMKMIKYYQCDIWYLDGGNGGSYAKDFSRMLVDDPANPHKLYWRMREEMQKYNQQGIVFFNVPVNPIGDVGFLESFSGVMTSEWRRGAAWMWKFKMSQHKDPLHTPLYIYWLPSVDGAFHNYMLGTGLTPTSYSRNLTAADVAYISARYEIRQLALVDANITPDWRSDAGTDTETMALTQNNAGFVFINHHGKEAVVSVGVDTAPLGVSDSSMPVHEWLMTIRNGKNWKGAFGQPDMISGYKQSRWIGESALTAEYLGCRETAGRLSCDVALNELQGKMWVLTQCPAMIWSLDYLPSQFRIPSTPGAEITGNYPDFTFKTEYNSNEIAFLLPDGYGVEKILLNDSEVPFRYGRENNALLAIAEINQAGTHKLEVVLAPIAGEKAVKSVSAQVNNRILSGKADTVNNTAVISIYSDGALCYTDTVNADGSFAVELPDTVKDGTYRITASNLSGKSHAETTLEIAGIGKPVILQEVMPHIYPETTITPVHNNNMVFAAAAEFTPSAAYARVDADDRLLEVGTLPAVTTYYSSAAAGLEMQVQRYIEIELSGNLLYYNLYGQEPKRHFVRIDSPAAVAAVLLDFHTPAGYTHRTLAGLGHQNLDRGADPAQWGTGKAPDSFFALCNFIQDTDNDTVRFWIDTKKLHAPADWDGKVYFSLIFQVGAPNRQLAAKVLDTSNTLPAGAAVFEGINLKAEVNEQIFQVHKFDDKSNVTGNWNSSEWQSVAELPAMTMISTPYMPAPFASRSKVARDNDNLYILVNLQDEPGRILETAASQKGTPWFSDSVEFWLQTAANSEKMLHGVIDAENNAYCAVEYVDKTNNMVEVLNVMPFFSSVEQQNGEWSVLITIPLRELGGSPLAFNIMRNRVKAGALDCYTTVPGKSYFCGEVYFLNME